MIKKILTLLFLPLMLYGTARFCHRETQGFRMSKVTANFSSNANWEILPLPEKEQEIVDGILDQKFTYLGRGFQSFVFLSEDQKYVLKLFNNAYQWRLTLLNTLPSFPLWEEWQQEKIHKIQRKLEKTFGSYKIAFEELKELTGLLYLHLDQTHPLHKKLTILDKLGIGHTIDLDSTAFLLQKKADLVYPKIDSLMQAKQLSEAKNALSSLLTLITARCKKGIGDSDALIRTNFGFLENQAVQIDVGPFSKDPDIQNPEVYLKEIGRITMSLKHWLENNHPELVPHLLEKLEELKQESV
jgi:hypothetical protein